MKLTLDQRYVAPLLVTAILVAANLRHGMLESYGRTGLAIAVAMLAEIALGLLFYRKFPHLASAYITGISVGVLIRSPWYWPYALCSAISILSKYVLRWNGRHLWNPSNFGIVMMVLLAPAAVATLSIQWDNSAWPLLVIWGLGAVITARLKRFHICATYVLSFLTLAAVRSTVTGQGYLAEIAPITGPMYQLFIFFMITDPRTTVRTRRGQVVVAFCVALAEFILRLLPEVFPVRGEVGYLFAHAPYLALFLVGPAANAIEIRTGSTTESSRPGGTRHGEDGFGRKGILASRE